MNLDKCAKKTRNIIFSFILLDEPVLHPVPFIDIRPIITPNFRHLSILPNSSELSVTKERSRDVLR